MHRGNKFAAEHDSWPYPNPISSSSEHSMLCKYLISGLPILKLCIEVCKPTLPFNLFSCEFYEDGAVSSSNCTLTYIPIVLTHLLYYTIIYWLHDSENEDLQESEIRAMNVHLRCSHHPFLYSVRHCFHINFFISLRLALSGFSAQAIQKWPTKEEEEREKTSQDI